MANRRFNDLQVVDHHVKIVCGSFRPNGSSAVSNTTNTGTGFTVARTGAGAFTITLADSLAFNSVISAQVSLQIASAADLKVNFLGALTPAAASRTFPLVVLAVATPTDIASDANARIHFALYLKNSAVVA